MNRDAAIEAGARVLHEQWQTSMDVPSGVVTFDDESEILKELIRQQAAAVIDAAAPHLTGEPVGYDFVSLDNLHATAQEAIAERDRFVASVNGRKPRWPVVGFVPVEDQP